MVIKPDVDFETYRLAQYWMEWMTDVTVALWYTLQPERLIIIIIITNVLIYVTLSCERCRGTLQSHNNRENRKLAKTEPKQMCQMLHFVQPAVWMLSPQCNRRLQRARPSITNDTRITSHLNDASCSLYRTTQYRPFARRHKWYQRHSAGPRPRYAGRQRGGVASPQSSHCPRATHTHTPQSTDTKHQAVYGRIRLAHEPNPVSNLLSPAQSNVQSENGFAVLVARVNIRDRNHILSPCHAEYTTVSCINIQLFLQFTRTLQ